MLASIQVVIPLIGTLLSESLDIIDLVNGITRVPLQSESKKSSHLGIGICRNYVWLPGVIWISWSTNCPHMVKAKVTLFLFKCGSFLTLPTTLLTYLGFGLFVTG